MFFFIIYNIIIYYNFIDQLSMSEEIGNRVHPSMQQPEVVADEHEETAS